MESQEKCQLREFIGFPRNFNLIIATNERFIFSQDDLCLYFENVIESHSRLKRELNLNRLQKSFQGLNIFLKTGTFFN